MMVIRTTLTLVVILAFASLPAAPASDDGESQQEIKRWRDYYRHVAHSYQMRFEQPAQGVLDVSDNSIFHYANLGYPSKSHGALFVWMDRGRPEAVGAVWSACYGQPGTRSVFHEFQSLSRNNLQATWNGKQVWRPRGPGVELKPIPHAARPVPTPALRLTQLRALAEEFTVYRTRGDEERLRGTRQPMYRYEVAPGEILDGAIFGFFDDVWWDPEVLLLIEARETANGYEWQFAGARMTDRAARIEHAGVNVWSVPEVTQRDKNAAYAYYFYGAETLGLSAPQIDATP